MPRSPVAIASPTKVARCRVSNSPVLLKGTKSIFRSAMLMPLWCQVLALGSHTRAGLVANSSQFKVIAHKICAAVPTKPGPPGAQESRIPPGAQESRTSAAHKKAGPQRRTRKPRPNGLTRKLGPSSTQAKCRLMHATPHHEPPELPQVIGTIERQWCGCRPKARDARHATAQLALALGVQHPHPGRPFLLPRARDRHAQRLAR